MKRLLLSAALTFTLATLPVSGAPQTRQRRANPDEPEIAAFRLNMDNINKFGTASAAIAKLGHDDPALKKQIDDDSKGAKTIQTSVDNIDKKYPAIAGAIRAAGLSTREYVVMTGTIMSTTMAVGMKKQGMMKEIPPSVSPENAAFVEQNYDKISAMLTKLMSESNR